MNKEFKKYFLQLTFLTFAIFIIAFGMFSFIFKDFYQPVFWILLTFFYVIHIIGHFILVFTYIKKKVNFGNSYFFSFGIKFLSYLIFLVLYLSMHKENALFFVICMFTLYIIYTVFEVRTTISISKSMNKNIEKSN